MRYDKAYAKSTGSDDDDYSNLDDADDAKIIRAAHHFISAYNSTYGASLAVGAQMRDFLYMDDAQWKPSQKDDRMRRFKTVFQNNMLLPIEMSILAEQRAADPQVIISARNAEVPSKTVKIVEGLTNSIAYESMSEVVYSQVYADSRDLGFGVARLAIEQESSTSFNNVIRIRNMPDALAAFFDPAAQDVFKVEGDYAGYWTSAPLASLRRKYPKKDLRKGDGFPIAQGYLYAPLNQDDLVVLEFACKHYFTSYMYKLDDGSEMTKTEYKEVKKNAALVNRAVRKKYNELTKGVKKHGKAQGVEKEIVDLALGKIPEPEIITIPAIVKKKKFVDWAIKIYTLTSKCVLEKVEWPLKTTHPAHAAGYFCVR